MRKYLLVAAACLAFGAVDLSVPVPSAGHRHQDDSAASEDERLRREVESGKGGEARQRQGRLSRLHEGLPEGLNLVPRTRSSHHNCRESDYELRVQSGTRI